MSRRKAIGSSPQSNGKRARLSPLNQPSDEPAYHTKAQMNTTYGQTSVFPGLDDPLEATSNGSECDALEYLRSVRSEARHVPTVLVAPERAEELLGCSDDMEGWYHDGVYCGAPAEGGGFEDYYDDGFEEGELAEEDEDAQEAYYAALLSRFSAFREALSKPPIRIIHTQSSHPSSVVTDFSSRYKDFHYALRSTAPTAQGIVALTQREIITTLLRLVSVLEKRYFLAPNNEAKFIGSWAYALLAKCHAIGEMNSEEVSVLRLLAKEAIKLAKRISAHGIEDDAFEENSSMTAIDESSYVGEASSSPNLGHNIRHGGSSTIASSSDQPLEENTLDTVVEGRSSGISDEMALGSPKVPENQNPNDVTEIGTGDSQIEPASLHIAENVITHEAASDPMNDGTELEDGEISDEPSSETSYRPPESDVFELELAKQRILLDMSKVKSLPDTKSDIALKNTSIGKINGHDSEVNALLLQTQKDLDCGGDEGRNELIERALATLDIIVTIVGEVFGQRDLLGAREVWE